MDYIKKLIKEALLIEGVANVSDVNDAINNLTQVEIRYLSKGENVATGRRIIYPVAYGLTKSGNPVVRAFEPYGDTTSKVPAWKFFRLDRIKNWRPLKKTFKGIKLDGFNENGDETMSVVYNIANITGKPSKFNIPKQNDGPITKGDISKKEREKEIDSLLKHGEKYGSEEIVNDLMRYIPQGNDPLSGIKKQMSEPKQMVSTETLKQIEKDNARKKLAQAKKKGIKLDNEQELINLIKGKENNGPITKSEINPLSNNKGSIVPAESGPITKNDLKGQNFEISNDDLDKIKQQWGLS